MSGVLSGAKGTLLLLLLGVKGHGTYLVQPVSPKKHGEGSFNSAQAALPCVASLQAPQCLLM